jgi:hypothetical protein
MASPALLNDVGLMSSWSLAIRVGVALIGLGGVNLVFLKVSPKFIAIFPMLSDPIPYSESELLSSLQRLFNLAPCFLITFSSFSNFLLYCAKSSLWGWFLSGFLRSMKIGFFQSSFLILMTIFCVVHSVRSPMLLAGVAILLEANFLQDSGRRLNTRSLAFFFALVRSLLVGL